MLIRSEILKLMKDDKNIDSENIKIDKVNLVKIEEDIIQKSNKIGIPRYQSTKEKKML